MTHNCVLVADGSRARFFKLQDVEFPELESGPNLTEINDMVNPEKEVHQRDLWSDAKSGRNRVAAGGMAHGYDDHRAQHEDEYERRFARDIAREVERLTSEASDCRLVIVAQRRILGFLRSELESLARQSRIEIRELAKDLCKLAPRELHDFLARERLLPKRRQPQVAGV